MNAAKMCGKLPGGLARTVKDSLKAKIDVRSLLMRFFSDRCNSDYSWSRPNSRYVASGLYLPALESRELGEIAIGIDTSGSVSAESLSYARSILESIIEELSPLAVNVYYFDSKVSSVDRFDRGDTLTWKPTGFGGTDFRPVLSEIEREGSAVCAVIITDLEGPFPETCNLPVIWLSTEAGNSAPFGEVVYLDR
jgi:predicted metal-dependent peptidase